MTYGFTGIYWKRHNWCLVTVNYVAAQIGYQHIFGALSGAFEDDDANGSIIMNSEQNE